MIGIFLDQEERKEGNRMKKSVLWLMAAFLLLSFQPARASSLVPEEWGKPAATSVPPFSFRGGVTWNMTRDQVRQSEGVELTERSQENWAILYPAQRVEVSRYQAELVYMFFRDQLKMITYDFGPEGTAADFAYLTGALDSVYGEHTEPDPGIVAGLMDQIYPGYYTADQLHSMAGWNAGEDTRVYLYYYSPTAYAILYVMSGNETAAPGSYVTTGL